LRCEYVNGVAGQCKREAEQGQSLCPLHVSPGTDAQKWGKRMYAIQNHARRVRHSTFSDHEELRTIKEEIAIARTLLEERLNTIKTDADLIAACGPLNTLLLTIERLTTSCLKLDQTVGNLLGKPTLLRIASDTVDIILHELEDIPHKEVIVDKISQKMLEVINNIEEDK